MFNFFKSPTFLDPVLGELVRSRGHWRGTLELTRESIMPLILAGSRAQPEPRAVAIARTLRDELAAWRPSIEVALFEHYQPYAEAVAAGELSLSGEPPPVIRSPGEVWPHVSLVFVSILPLDGVLTVELGYTMAWDEEHTLGARVQDGTVLELCGSVLPP